MSRNVTLLHPELQKIIEKFLLECQNQNLPVLITETLRTQAEQDKLYAQGRTAPGNIITNCKGSNYQSGHQWGVAFDFCRNVKGHEYDDSDGFFKKVGTIGKSFGLAWGGDWKSPDKPHLEIAKFMPGNSTSTLKKTFGTPDKFKTTWSNAASEALLNMLPTLKQGSKGEFVKTAQLRLNELGYGLLAVDGDFGAKTDKAVRDLQKAKSLDSDGIIGAKTWAVLGVKV